MFDDWLVDCKCVGFLCIVRAVGKRDVMIANRVAVMMTARSGGKGTGALAGTGEGTAAAVVTGGAVMTAGECCCQVRPTW